MKTPLGLAALTVVTIGAGVAAADESTVRLNEGAEATTVIANCSGCHSLDYIQMNSRFLKRADWEASVKKMVTVMGAPVSEVDAARIVDYLTREYGATN
jgi:cytochrome c5